ncbi:Protein of unknown function [Gryllus bimaculatus]|nr:Protein of unknown function [Gryllus bimaculatus]
MEEKGRSAMRRVARVLAPPPPPPPPPPPSPRPSPNPSPEPSLEPQLLVYDSSTKVPDGLLTGNVVQLGNFDECLATHALDADGHGLFWGQYCLAGLAVERTWPPPNASAPAPAPANNFSLNKNAILNVEFVLVYVNVMAEMSDY